MSVWRGLTVAFLGGDSREAEMAALARAEGAVVRVFGGTGGTDAGKRVVETLEEALRDARVAVGPVPLQGVDGRLFAPAAAGPIFLEQRVLELMSDPAHLVIGKADEHLAAAAVKAGVTVHEYESDPELMLLRAPAIAEGAIRVAIERSPVTIHGSRIGVVGFGRTGQALVRALIGLGARVDVFARRAEARAGAYALGASPRRFEDIPHVFADLDIVYSTVPAVVLTRELLEALPRGTLVVDMAAPPGSVDREAAGELALDAFWARGLGASAPRTVGRSQWAGVTRIVCRALGHEQPGAGC